MRKVVDVLVGKVSGVSYGGVSIGGAAGEERGGVEASVG